MAGIDALLAALPFFAGLDPAHVRLIAGCAEEVSFAADEVIFHEGRQADRFYLIRTGKIVLEVQTPTHGARAIQTLGTDDVLGASWLFPPYVCHYDARAVEAVEAVGFHAPCLRAACEEDHDLGYALMKRFAAIMVQRLIAARLQLLDVYARPVR
jgi:CRP-like cAMP-binding protein